MYLVVLSAHVFGFMCLCHQNREVAHKCTSQASIPTRCMHTYMYVYVCICVHGYVYTCVYVCKYTSMHAYVYTCSTYLHTHTHIPPQATRALENEMDRKSRLQQEAEQLKTEANTLSTRLEDFEENTPRLRDASRRLDVVQKDLEHSQVTVTTFATNAQMT